MSRNRDHWVRVLAAAGVAAALALPARAQLPGQLGNALGGLTGGGAAGGGVPSVGAASLGNIAGVLQYCISNNYFGGNAGAAAPVQQSLLGKLGGAGQAAGNSDYTSGASGLLQTGGGQTTSLGSSLLAPLAQQVCSMVLQRAQSLL